MKILPISDIHSNFAVLDYIEKAGYDFDVLTISGDVFEGRILEPIEFVEELEKFQKAIDKPIVLCQGNHDFWDVKILMDSPNIHMLHNSGVEIDGVTFYGIPQTVRFLNWNHLLDDESELMAQVCIDELPEGLDVLLSHGPPYGHGDNCNQPIYGNTKDSKLGCKSLLKGIRKKSPRFVFCGHIHTGDRHTIIQGNDLTKQTEVYNVSVLDERYTFLGYNPKPQVIEV